MNLQVLRHSNVPNASTRMHNFCYIMYKSSPKISTIIIQSCLRGQRFNTSYKYTFHHNTFDSRARGLESGARPKDQKL